MDPELRVVFRRLLPTDLILARVRARFAAMQRFGDDIVRCHVDLESKPIGAGEHYRVFVQLTLMRGDVMRIDEDRDLPQDDLVRSLDRAFDALGSQLQARAAHGASGPRRTHNNASSVRHGSC